MRRGDKRLRLRVWIGREGAVDDPGVEWEGPSDDPGVEWEGPADDPGVEWEGLAEGRLSSSSSTTAPIQRLYNINGGS